MNRRLLPLLIACSTLAVAACGSDDPDTAGTTAPATGEVTVEKAWARTSPMMSTAGAAYMVITSPTTDRLVGAAVDASIAATAEIHETTMGGDMGGDMGSTPTSEAPMMMREVDGVDLPAGTAVAFEPGGYHVMLLDLAEPLEVGTTFTLTLTFEQAGTRDVTVTVADEAP